MTYYNNNVVYKHSALRRIVFYGAFMLIFALLSVGAYAQEDEVSNAENTSNPYIVTGIEVDITADNAVEAREQAFEVAQVKAYEVLARRILSPEQLENFETPSATKISSFVRDYEVTNEKLSAVRYNGIYQIRFSPKTFADLQQESNPQIQQAGDTLVIPVYQRAGRSFLWQANPFLNAWARARDNQQAGRFIVPVGDVDDVTGFGDNQGLNYDPSRLNAMRLRYQASQVALMTVEPKSNSDGSRVVELSLYNAQPYGPELARRINVPAYPGEMEEQLYNRVVSEAVRMAGSPTATPDNATTVTNNTILNLPTAGPANTMEVQTTFSSVREWIQVKKTLEGSPFINQVSVSSMSPRSATLNLNYQGDPQNLTGALQQLGFSLVPMAQGQPMQLVRGRLSQPTGQPSIYNQNTQF